MQRKMISLFLVILFIIVSVAAGCSVGKSADTKEAAAAGTEKEEPVTETTESVNITEEEVLFDFYNLPPDWPRSVPIHGEMKVSKYERSENSMLASGNGKYMIAGLSNFYTNARKETGGGYNWEFDPAKESVTSGPEQVFYFIDDEGKFLTIKLAEVEKDVIKFELDFKE